MLGGMYAQPLPQHSTWIGSAVGGTVDAAGTLGRGLKRTVTGHMDSWMGFGGPATIDRMDSLKLLKNEIKADYNRHFMAVQHPEQFQAWSARVDQFSRPAGTGALIGSLANSGPQPGTGAVLGSLANSGLRPDPPPGTGAVTGSVANAALR